MSLVSNAVQRLRYNLFILLSMVASAVPRAQRPAVPRHATRYTVRCSAAAVNACRHVAIPVAAQTSAAFAQWRRETNA